MACKDFSIGYTCADSVMGPFIGTTSTTTILVAYNEKGITYLATTNVGWLPYLPNEGLWYVHYSAHRVRRKFGLKQDVPDDFTLVLDTTPLVYRFPTPTCLRVLEQTFHRVHHSQFPKSESLYYPYAGLLASCYDFIQWGAIR